MEQSQLHTHLKIPNALSLETNLVRSFKDKILVLNCVILKFCKLLIIYKI